MKDYAKKLYNSKRWQGTRASYLRSVGGLCERCLAKGIYRPAVIVHHKVYISPENIDNPEIALSWNNLEALCRQCHNEEHEDEFHKPTAKAGGRYCISADGSVEIKSPL